MNRLLSSVIALALVGCSAATVSTGLPFDPILTKLVPSRPDISFREVRLADQYQPVPAAFRSRRIRNLLTGREELLEIAPRGAHVAITDETGCRSIRPRDWFSPSLSWAGCGSSEEWHTAEAEVRVEDPLYPLRLGATGVYERHAVSHTGKRSTRTTTCEVTDTVAVDLGSREAPAFVVECDDGRILRTTWYAPTEGPVAYREVHKKRGLREAWVVADRTRPRADTGPRRRARVGPPRVNRRLHRGPGGSAPFRGLRTGPAVTLA